MQHSADDHNSIINTVNQEMPGFVNWITCDVGPALTQVPRVNPISKFGSYFCADSIWIPGNIADASNNQRRVSLPCSFTEMSFRPLQDCVNVIGGCIRDPVLSHDEAASRPRPEM